jgi:hypothetical protein
MNNSGLSETYLEEVNLCLTDLSLRFKHKSFGLDIKPLTKLPLPLSSWGFRRPS